MGSVLVLFHPLNFTSFCLSYPLFQPAFPLHLPFSISVLDQVDWFYKHQGLPLGSKVKHFLELNFLTTSRISLLLILLLLILLLLFLVLLAPLLLLLLLQVPLLLQLQLLLVRIIRARV